MTHVTCRLTANNRDQLRNPVLGNRVWDTFLQYGHSHVLLLLCTRRLCCCKLLDWLKLLSHSEHLYSFSPAWTLTCWFISINQSFLYWHMTKRIRWHLIQNCNTRKVNRNLYTACGLRSFYRPSVLCDRAFVCHVDDAAGCTTGAGAVRAGRGLHCC